MKRFHFGLEKVRLWRHEQAGLEEIKLQQLHSELRGFAAQKQDLDNQVSGAQQVLLQGSSINAEDLTHFDSFRQYVRARSVSLDAQARQCNVKIGGQRQNLTESRRKAELLDRLKEKSLAEWRLAYGKEQEALGTELFLAKRKREAGP